MKTIAKVGIGLGILGIGIDTYFTVKEIIRMKRENKEIEEDMMRRSKQMLEDYQREDEIIRRQMDEIASFTSASLKSLYDLEHDERTLEGSIELARKVGVPEEEILKNIEDVDKFFLE